LAGNSALALAKFNSAISDTTNKAID